MNEDEWVDAIERITDATAGGTRTWTQNANNIKILRTPMATGSIQVNDPSHPELPRFVEIYNSHDELVDRIEIDSVVMEVVNQSRAEDATSERLSTAIDQLLRAVHDSRTPDTTARVQAVLEGL